MNYTGISIPTQRPASADSNQRGVVKLRRGAIDKFINWWVLFIHQELPSLWHPLPSVQWSVLFFALLAVITLPLGSIIFWQTLENTELHVRYDSFHVNESAETNNTQREQHLLDNPDHGVLLQGNFIVPETMHSPVYVYYEITDFYQNHLRYVRSISDEQFNRGNISRHRLTLCEPYRLIRENASLPSRQRQTPDQRIINPCGLVAHSYFNDSFQLQSSIDGSGNDLNLTLKKTGIATEWDRRYLYGDHNASNFNDVSSTRGGGNISVPLNEDEDFMVWMKVGSKPTIRKLYAIIEDDIPQGSRLNFTINNRYNTYRFGGEKRLMLCTVNWTGGRNRFTGVLFFAIGIASALACLVILALDRHIDRSPGDIKTLSWIRKKKS